MSARTLFASILAAALLATGCAKKEESAPEAAAEPETPAVDLAAEEQAVKNRSGEWMNYANSKDAASIANKIFAADGMLIADEKAYKGAAAIQAAMEAEMKENPNSLVSWTSDQVRVSSGGDFAIENGSFTFDEDGDGKKSAIQGSFATTWAKIDGEWRVLSDAGGENAAAPTT
ncbi:MAG TPA: nuclear transport factor 2 family protein [Steroidobacteraceae bacterium]|nr:nuclear transport factor 2 family protein [Steroidobacteraceae bacterium]